MAAECGRERWMQSVNAKDGCRVWTPSVDAYCRVGGAVGLAWTWNCPDSGGPET